MFEKSIRAGQSSTRAARQGRCGEALDDLLVAFSAHHRDMAEAGPKAVYSPGDTEMASRESWRSIRLAEFALRDHCLVNVEGRGLEGPRRARRYGRR